MLSVGPLKIYILIIFVNILSVRDNDSMTGYSNTRHVLHIGFLAKDNLTPVPGFSTK